MTITVKLFAIYQETYQKSELILNLPKDSKAKDVLDLILQEKSELESWRTITKLAVNLEFVSPDFPLKNGDEIALIPPVSGG